MTNRYFGRVEARRGDRARAMDVASDAACQFGARVNASGHLVLVFACVGVEWDAQYPHVHGDALARKRVRRGVQLISQLLWVASPCCRSLFFILVGPGSSVEAADDVNSLTSCRSGEVAVGQLVCESGDDTRIPVAFNLYGDGNLSFFCDDGAEKVGLVCWVCPQSGLDLCFEGEDDPMIYPSLELARKPCREIFLADRDVGAIPLVVSSLSLPKFGAPRSVLGEFAVYLVKLLKNDGGELCSRCH